MNSSQASQVSKRGRFNPDQHQRFLQITLLLAMDRSPDFAISLECETAKIASTVLVQMTSEPRRNSVRLLSSNCGVVLWGQTLVLKGVIYGSVFRTLNITTKSQVPLGLLRNVAGVG